jgi:citrate lyase beta subunit
MKQSLTPDTVASIRTALTNANVDFVRAYPGASPQRQPVHTVYGGAQLFTAQTAGRMSETALKSLAEHAPDATALASALGQTDAALWKIVYPRIVEKLKREAVEDFRIDYEDGYGNRPDAEEDGHAESVALEVAKGMKAGTLPPFIGLRIKPFNEENVRRSVRTLDIFMSTLLGATGGKLPDNFVVTLPKITITAQSHALTQFLTAIEKKNGLAHGTIKFELMVETTQSILNEQGRCPLPEFVAAGEGRCVGAHFGTYDYTAGCGITAAHQTMANPVCDFAKHVMQVSLAGTPILLSDGATNIMPVGGKDTVHRAWRISYGHIRHSLETGYYQGWDLHPAQLPIRYAAVYAFFLESLEAASQRLKSFVDKAAKATLLGEVFDDAATGQGLLNFFLRGIACGAITEDEARATGLSLEEIRGRSFLKIIEGRRK